MNEDERALYRRALGTDRVRAQWRARCGHEGTAWTDGEGGVVVRCPHCLRDRVRTLREVHGSLPGSVDYLETMADKDLERQSLENQELTVDFDMFCRCARCDGLIHKDDARHWIPPGESSSCPIANRADVEPSEGRSA